MDAETNENKDEHLAEPIQAATSLAGNKPANDNDPGLDVPGEGFTGEKREEAANGKCALCAKKLSDMCIECQASSTFQDVKEEDCVCAWGACGHAYHNHCISDWLEDRNYCPLDKVEWKCEKLGK